MAEVAYKTESSFTEYLIDHVPTIIKEAVDWSVSDDAEKNSEVTFRHESEEKWGHMPPEVAAAYLKALGKIVDDRVLDVHDKVRESLEGKGHLEEISFDIAEEICSVIFWDDVVRKTVEFAKEDMELKKFQITDVQNYAYSVSWRIAAKVALFVRKQIEIYFITQARN